jgi:hypothetical protein
MRLAGSSDPIRPPRGRELCIAACSKLLGQAATRLHRGDVAIPPLDHLIGGGQQRFPDGKAERRPDMLNCFLAKVRSEDPQEGRRRDALIGLR